MNERHSKKLSYQLQQMAFQKYPFQINNKTFFCLQTYFQDQLLNGVQLQLKQAKGMTSEQQKIAYIAQTQQIIMPIGSNIISYNAQKRGYSLLTEVNGYVQILRTYTSKINNKTYIFWLESDEEGLNMRVTDSSRQKNGQKGTVSNMGKMPSIWNLSSPLGALLNKKEISLDDREEVKVEDKTDIREEDKVDDKKQGKKGTINKLMQALGRMSKPQSSPKKQAVVNSDKPIQQASKSRKKVRIEAPQASQQQPPPQTPKKRMRICLFDHQKKCLLHKQPLQIEQHQTISQIILYFITQKMVGYVINDENEERGRIYYKKIKIDEGQWQQGKEQKGKRKGGGVNRRVEKWGVLEAIFEIPLLKYNGETDQYLFKDLNTVYSVQVYQVQHEMAVRNGSSSKSLLPSKKPTSSKSLIPSKNLKLTSKNSILFSSQSQSQPLDQQNLSKQIQKVTNKLITPNKNQPSIKDKYAIRICQQIQLFTDQTIIDISINQVYLVVLTNQWIRFYSIFNLNTLLFKCEMHDVKECPPPTTVELNKSYLLLTHENSTLVSSYTILQRKLKYNSTCQVEIEHCQSILKLFMNSYNCEVAILAKQFQIEGRVTNLLKSKRIIQNAFHSYKKTFLDLSLAYINFSSTKCQTKSLFMKNQRFRNVLTCKWNSQYLLQTDNQILAKDWREAFQNLKCSCLHPTGQYLIIGFNDCFKIYAVTQQGLQNTYMSDGVKDCQAIAYSEYGQHFAVGSSNSIGIYSSYDCCKKQTITLPMGSLVQSLQYRNSHLICTLRTRRIIVYHSLLQYKEIFTFNPKNYLNQNKHQFSKKGESQQNLLALTIKGLVGLQVNSLYYDLELGVVIFSSGRKVVFYNVVTNESLGNYQIQAISCMEYNKQLATLFLGTFSGQLIAFPWPNKPSNIMSQVPRFKFHSQKITKIRLTSDYKYLITLGNDMSIYKCQVSYILNLKRLKGTEIAEYKGNKNVLTYCNFLLNKGVCQFSHSQTTEKLEIKKQLEEEVVNTVFMLPEERMKQKEQLFDQLKVTQERLDDENSKEYEPLQEETAGLRNRIYKTKDDLHKMKKFTQKQVQRHKQQYQQKTSKLLKTYSQLNTQYRKLKLTLDDQLSTKKLQYQTQYQQLLKQNQQKQQQLLTQISQKQQQNQTIKQRFLELQLIEQEKQTYLTRQLEMYQAEFQQITTKNGQLACKNSAIEKELLVIKYRIQELKLVVLNANKSIDKLKTKNLRENQEKQVFENLLVENAKIDVSEMEKKYIKVTKQLIEKNKVIDINLNQYEKEKEILVQLEKTVEKTQEEIDRIVDSLQQEKDFMKFLTMKCQAATQRYKEVANLRTQKKTIKNKTKLQLNKFFQQLQKLEKQLQSAFNQNKKQFSSQTTQVINKIKLFSSTSPKPQVESDKNQKSLETGNRKTHRKDKEDEQCDNVVERENPLYELLGTFKKTGSAFNKDKRGKNARCVTEEKSARSVKETNTLVDHRNKTTFKLNYKKLTDRQKTISPQSSLLNNTISTSKLQQQSSLLKTTSKYYQVKTQASYQTDRPTSNPFNPSLAQKSPFSSYQRQKLIQKQKQNVFKKLTSEDKLVNKIRNDKKLFMTSKKRLHLQNQDLINTYNSLTYDNKYFKNILKAYEQTLDQDDKNYIFSNPQQFSKNFVAFAAQSTNTGNSKSYKNLPAQSGKFGNFSEQSQEQKLVTPFDKYLKNKEDKISQLQNKTLGNEDFTITQRDHFKPTLNKITKSKASQQKRVKTLPCVQYAL